MKKWITSSLILCLSIFIISGCGLDHNKQSIKKNNIKTTKNISSILGHSFPEGEVLYVMDIDSDSPIYKNEKFALNYTTITPYISHKNKVKIEIYDEGNLQKTYIADYSIKKAKLSSENNEIYKYHFSNVKSIFGNNIKTKEIYKRNLPTCGNDFYITNALVTVQGKTEKVLCSSSVINNKEMLYKDFEKHIYNGEGCIITNDFKIFKEYIHNRCEGVLIS